ncbi:probable LRR receptor-like serine/threonine-protein kinase At2g16250 [Typha latifolia]|uniref:probable LRR receptor-like serine/threonine-protein kinase At2g16250 n=1 Tax=Typha latifolia TaxID=4733 RepID=UPI003C2E97CB
MIQPMHRRITVRSCVALCFSFFFLLPSSPVAAQSLTSSVDLAALYSLRGSLGLRAREWPRKTDPCASWAGVDCRGGRVVSLNLSGLPRTRLGRLNPQFAVDGLRNLSRLESFNASGFLLPGPIPDWFGRGVSRTLAVLDLRSAAVSGEVPASLAELGNLTYLDLSFNLLSGPIPVALGTLPNLKTLLLSNNSLSGSVPPQLGDLKSLVLLDLSSNSLSGIVPDDLGTLRNLQSLNLASNILSSTLSTSLFSALFNLQFLNLRRNNFSGAIPVSLWSLPELRVLDVSENRLTGSLPGIVPTSGIAITANVTDTVLDLSKNFYYGPIPSGFAVLFTRFSSVDFSDNYFDGAFLIENDNKNVTFGLNCFRNATNQRNPDVCEEFYAEHGIAYDGHAVPPQGAPPQPPSSSTKKSHKKLKYILIGVIGGLLLLVILVVAIVLCCLFCGARKAEQRESSVTAAPSGQAGGGGTQPSAVPVNLAAVGDSFTLEQLAQAASQFGDANLIKRGHSGDLYHGVLEDGNSVVVKRIELRGTKKEAYIAELDLFSKGLHERLVPFLGHCLDNENEKFLVYRLVPNGDLSNALHRKSGQEEEGMQSLDWIKRLKIAIGVAEALCYLHHDCTPPMVHRDVQASSILLDDKFEVRLGSLSEVCTQEGEGHKSVITKLLRFQTSEQGASSSSSTTCAYDVYCLGKVLLELVTGKLGISGSNDAATNEWLEHTLRYINIYEKELVTKIVDPSLIVDEDHLEEVWAMAIVAKSCLNPKPSKRPPMRYILRALENPLKVVREDNNSSSARLRATSSRGSWNAAFFGSWRHSSSDIVSVPGPPREDHTLKRSGTLRSQGSNGEHSFSHKRQSKEIFPEPSELRDIED